MSRQQARMFSVPFKLIEKNTNNLFIDTCRYILMFIMIGQKLTSFAVPETFGS